MDLVDKRIIAALSRHYQATVALHTAISVGN
jgi:hypothetical protein